MKENKYPGFVADNINTTSWKIDEITGFLTAPVVLARTGIQTYYGYELGLNDRALDKINVYRSPEEVFSDAAISSYQNLVITNDHPSEEVNVDNVKRLQVGSVSNVIRDGNVIRGIATITDKDQIKKTQSGKVEVSLGYLQDLKQFNQTVDGVFCEFQQTNIRGNHLANVDKGRCGATCRISNDNNSGGKLPTTITIDGIDYTTDDKQLSQAINKLMKDAEISITSLEERLTALENELKKANSEKEVALAEKNAAEKATMSEPELEQIIEDRASKKAKLISQAKLVLGDKMPVCVNCDLEIMKAVIGDSFSEDEIMGRTSEYINTYITALYDAAIKKFNEGRESLKEFGKEILKDSKSETITRDSARAKYMKTLGIGVNQ